MNKLTAGSGNWSLCTGIILLGVSVWLTVDPPSFFSSRGDLTQLENRLNLYEEQLKKQEVYLNEQKKVILNMQQILSTFSGEYHRNDAKMDSLNKAIQQWEKGWPQKE